MDLPDESRRFNVGSTNANNEEEMCEMIET